MRTVLAISLISQLDASAARQRTRHIAALCGFGANEQTRLSTTVSELARGAVDAAHPGQITFSLEGEAGRQALVITLARPAIGAAGRRSDDSDDIIDYAPLSHAAVLAASTNFLDRIDIDPDSNLVVLHKACPAGAPMLDPVAIGVAVGKLAGLPGAAALSEAHQRNRALEASNEGIQARNGQLQRQADVLLTADRRKDEFLAVLAHELRGPLSALAMAGELLQKGQATPERVAGVGQLIARQTAHMSRMVEDLLDVSRIVRNEVSIDRLPVDLGDVIIAAIEQSAPAAQRRGHTVTPLLPETALFVQGDRTRLIQVLGNLIGNAIRYTPLGGAIDVSLEGDAREVRVRVSDNGVGMAPELLPNLFDLFVQARRSSDSRDSGLGLGLALVKALMEAHGGDVVAHSDGLGLGSCFEISFPRLRMALETQVPALQAS